MYELISRLDQQTSTVSTRVSPDVDVLHSLARTQISIHHRIKFRELSTDRVPSIGHGTIKIANAGPVGGLVSNVAHSC